MKRNGLAATIARAMLAGAALATPAASWAQAVPDDAIPNNVDDFRLGPDGTVAPPAPVPSPAPAPAPLPAPTPIPPSADGPGDPPVASDIPAAPTADPAETSSPAATAPARRTIRPFATRRSDRPRASRVRERRVGGPVADAPALQDDAANAAGPVAQPAAPVAATPVAPSPAVEPASDTSWWPWAALAGLGALAAAALVRRRKPREMIVETEAEEPDYAEEPVVVSDDAAVDAEFSAPVTAEPEPAARILPVIDLPPVVGPETEDVIDLAPFAIPASPAPVQTPDPVVEPLAEPVAAPRPRLSLTFSPAAASATEAQASVQFMLTVSNVGDAPARRVRMEARMFAMGEDHDAALTAFFTQPMERATPIASTIPAGVSTELRTQVTLPGAAVRPIRHADRVLFVPVVAVNVLYEWEEEAGGQTAMSYVIGRENKPPVAKMAPFRLDQGPRMYREVGHRVHELRRVG